MSNQYQYRKADKGLYGPVTMDEPNWWDYQVGASDASGEVYDMTCPTFEPDLKKYKCHLESLPRVASVPSCEWKDGEIVEEGKDFKFQVIDDGENGHDGKVMYSEERVFAVPISGGEVKEEGTKPIDDGWKFDYKYLKDLTQKVNAIDHGDGLSMEEVEAVLLAINHTPSEDASKEREIAEAAWNAAFKFYTFNPTNGYSQKENPHPNRDEYLKYISINNKQQ